MAYLKTHYKNEFFANLLTNVIGSEYKTKQYIEEAKANNLIVEKPDINYSTDKYVVRNSKIYYPFSNLKSVGGVSAKLILSSRKSEFRDIYDCFSKLVIAGVTKKTIECLVLSDCFKSFNYNRKTLMNNLDNLINYAELTKDLDPSLVMIPEIEICNDYTDDEILTFEKDIFGFYLTHHPTTRYYKNNEDCIRINDVKNYFNKNINTLILVEKVNVINTKKGEKMAFVSGSDETGIMDFTMFPRTYTKYADISRGDIIKVRGIVEKRLDEYKVVIQNLEKLN